MPKLTLHASRRTKDTPAGKIPVDWAWVRLASVATFRSGGTPSREDFNLWKNQMPWFSGKDLKSFHLRDSQEHVSLSAVGNGTRAIPADSVLVLVRGMALMKGVPIGITTRESAFNQDVRALLPDSTHLDARFLAYFLLSEDPRLRSYVTIAGHGTGRLPIEALEEYPTPLPPLSEQRKIAEILSTWDDALEKLDSLIAAKERRLRGLMQQLVTGKRRLSAFRKRPWKPLHMSDVLERVFRPAEIDSSAPLALVSIRRRCGGLFRRPDILASEYKTQDLHELKAGDFLISKRQVVHGAWALVNAEFEDALVSKEYAILVNRAPDVLDMRFFAWLSKTPRMLRLARVSSTGVHIEKLIFDPDVFLRESIRVPSDVAEQEAIADILDASAEELGLLREQRAALDLQKRGLMQQLLTGKVRVRP